MRTGTRVMESSAAPAMANVLVKASGLNSRPSCCSSVNTGRNETVMMRREKNSGGPTCTALSRTTSQSGRPGSCSRCLCMFSIITIAASTMAPIAIAIPPRLMMLALTPILRITRNEMRMPKGSVTIATTAERRCSRNSTQMSATMMDSSSSVRRRFPMARWIRSERS